MFSSPSYLFFLGVRIKRFKLISIISAKTFFYLFFISNLSQILNFPISTISRPRLKWNIKSKNVNIKLSNENCLRQQTADRQQRPAVVHPPTPVPCTLGCLFKWEMGKSYVSSPQVLFTRIIQGHCT